MKLINVLLILQASLYVYSITGMENMSETALAKIFQRRAYSIKGLAHAQHVEKASAEKRIAKPRKIMPLVIKPIKSIKGGFVAPASSPANVENLEAHEALSDDSDEAPEVSLVTGAHDMFSLMIKARAVNLGAISFLCPRCHKSHLSHCELEAHMFVAHQVYLCICNELFHDLSSYLMHRPDCPVN